MNWIKFDRYNIPERSKPYLITDGDKIDISYYPDFEWGLFDQYGIRKVSDVTHFIPIELSNLDGVDYIMNSNGGMTPQEKEIADHIVAAWNGFVTLKPTHPDDINEFGNAIHRLQHLLGMRVLRRDYPDYWITKSK